jgi:hypothetical protein
MHVCICEYCFIPPTNNPPQTFELLARQTLCIRTASRAPVIIHIIHRQKSKRLHTFTHPTHRLRFKGSATSCVTWITVFNTRLNDVSDNKSHTRTDDRNILDAYAGPMP